MMKFFKLFAIVAIVALGSCGKVTDKCIIKGQLSGGDGDVVIYPYQEVHSQKESDSLSYKAKVIDGKFEIEMDAELACRPVYIKIGDDSKRYTVFSEPGIIRIFEKDGVIVGEGSAVNDEYHELVGKLNYEAYNQLKYKHELSPEEQGIVDNYIAKLWDLVKDYSVSIPLSRLFYEKYWGADVETLNKIVNAFSKDIHQSYYLQKLIVRRANQLRVSIGKQAPAFTLKSVSREDVSLEMYKGKFVLVDFWASWCGPCRAEIPNLKEIYKDYQSKGLQILSVSTDANEKAWLKAVDKEQMLWKQVRDTKSVSDSYNITSIPAIFLLDPNGKIIDKGLHGQNLRNRIEEVLK